MSMILAGDVGGTKTLLGLFDAQTVRPEPRVVQSYVTTDFTSLTEMIAEFSQKDDVRGVRLGAACFGVAGPVLGDTAELTNVPFVIDAPEIARTFDIGRVSLLNDLQSMAYAVPVLRPDELVTLQAGHALRGGNMALLAAGTGLGEALLHNVKGRFIPSPTEAGHADWAARTDRDREVLRVLAQRYGRVEVEDVISGKGFVNLHRALHTSACAAGVDADAAHAPAAITTAALGGHCRTCAEVLDTFVRAYGAEAGNLALRTLATGGVFVGGGIAPKILPALADGRFMQAFCDKGAMRALVEHVPVHVILNAEAGLLGAAVHAATAD